jgi:acetyl-CoA carboxylase carboxyltransferase component
MAGQGFDPDFIFTWPTGRMGVMEGESAVNAVFGDRLADPAVAPKVEQMRADYDEQLDARFAAARGFADAVFTPEETRQLLGFALSVTAHYRGPHLGSFVLPPHDFQSGHA